MSFRNVLLSLLIFWACMLQFGTGKKSIFPKANFLSNAGNIMQAVSPPKVIKSSSKPKRNLMISMNPSMTSVLQRFSTMKFNSREDKVSAMVAAMKAASTQSQAPVIAALKPLGLQMQTYWLTNQIYLKDVKDRDSVLAETLTNIGAVKSINKEKRIPFLPIFNQSIGDAPNGTLWNIKRVRANKLWSKGIKGDGIIVATIDSGVRSSHEAIRDNYIGTENYGWYDPVLHTKEPNDMQGHGTHVTGTMAGTNGIGVAPNVKWMACKGCGVVNCRQHALLECGQYILCPSDPEGTHQNCTNVPHIVNNSWGGPGGQNWFNDILNAWQAAGIIAFFANGNSGPACNTAGSPGDHEYPVTVGCTDEHDKLSDFSSRGPTVAMAGNKSDHPFGGFFDAFKGKKTSTDIIKPEISAPGQNINSAGITSDVSYKILSGTSMASPLVAGASALLLSVNSILTMPQLKNLLYSTAKQKLPATDTPQCGPVPETEFPNCMYGHGRLDIYKAYQKMLKLMGKKDGTGEDDSEEEEEQMENVEEEGEEIGGEPDEKANSLETFMNAVPDEEVDTPKPRIEERENKKE